jgi:dihydrofolate synthase/folylpolyglutamate synthase
MGEEIEVDSPLAGRHQLRNVALAIAAAEELGQFGFKVTARQIEQGIRATRWPGRFQVLPPSAATHQHEMVLDVAHNPAGAWALRSALSETFGERELTLVFAAMRDKAIQEIADVLFPIAERVVLTHVSNPRAATTAELVQAGSRTGATLYTEETVAAALRKAHEVSKADGVIVVTGSIFLAGAAMAEMGMTA